MEKLKFKHVDGVFGMFWFFTILKTRGFEFVKLYFAKPTLTRCFNSAFLLFNLASNEVNTCPIYFNEEIFIRM